MSKENEVMMFRQGDVLIVRVPDGKEVDTRALRPIPREHDRVVLAWGEATGHTHAIGGQACSLYESHGPSFLDEAGVMAGLGLIARGGAVGGGPALPTPDRVLDVKEEVQLQHEEHDAITLPPGQYVIRQQSEYSPDEYRTVSD
jgi:hypothetical protein